MTDHSSKKGISVERRDGGIHAICFSAMASPCEMLIETMDIGLATEIGAMAAHETWRIEQKFSRYRDDGVLAAINRSGGRAINVDAETAALINFAARCYEISEGMFDVTSGILRRVWKFDGSDQIPADADVAALLPLIGFNKIVWQNGSISIPPGMELDLGGIGKEYAVDRVLDMISAKYRLAILVNFGGDLATNHCPATGPWQIGVERPDTHLDAAMVLELTQGALATSGDSHRFLIREGVRYGHILDPFTGWPVAGAPRSVTVAAGRCLEAGMLATIALLQGKKAKSYLDELDVKYWCAE